MSLTRINAATIARIENGTTDTHHVKTLAKLAWALGMTPGVLHDAGLPGVARELAIRHPGPGPDTGPPPAATVSPRHEGPAMITVDGEPAEPGPGGSSDREEAVRRTLLELKLCKALAAAGPPHELSTLLHGRIAEMLRGLKRDDAADPDAREAADLTDDELRETAGIVRAIRRLQPWTGKDARGYQGGGGFRVVLSGFALDLADELDKRAGRDGCNAR